MPTSYYSLLYLMFQVFLITIIFLWKKKGDTNTHNLVLLLIVLLSFNALLTYYGRTNPTEEANFLTRYVHLLPIVFVIITSSVALGHSGLLKRKFIKDIIPMNKGHKYEKTGLSETFSLELKNKLEHLMITQKPYLSHDLRLDDIAILLDISRHHASQVINENFALNFYDYINGYRIEEAKTMLRSNFGDAALSISEIAYECGFNNRVSFYKAFKKITRTTPSEYIVVNAAS